MSKSTMKSLFKYANEKGKVIFTTSQQRAQQYFNKDKSTKQFYHCGVVMISTGQIHEGLYRRIQPGIYKKSW